MILIKYFKGGREYANRTRDHVPRVGEYIQFNDELYKVINVIWIEDNTPEYMHVVIEKHEG